jgi:hypothetical protein
VQTNTQKADPSEYTMADVIRNMRYALLRAKLCGQDEKYGSIEKLLKEIDRNGTIRTLVIPKKDVTALAVPLKPFLPGLTQKLLGKIYDDTYALQLQRRSDRAFTTSNSTRLRPLPTKKYKELAGRCWKRFEPPRPPKKTFRVRFGKMIFDYPAT